MSREVAENLARIKKEQAVRGISIFFVVVLVCLALMSTALSRATDAYIAAALVICALGDDKKD